MADVAALTVSILGTQTVTPAANAAASALSGLENAAGRGVSAFTNMAAAAAKAALAVGAIGAGAAVAGMTNAISVAATFEQQLSAIAAVSSKTEVETVGGMKAISAAALELGKTTSFSATEAAAGMEEMVKAGVSLTDVMGGGAKAALDLAAAGALSVSEAATVASSAMNAFGLAGTDLAHIADTLANAASASATDVHQLGFGLASVGAVAHTVGLSFEDTTTAIAEFAQAGLKGSDAGTSFKTLLLSLTPTTKPAIAAMKELGIITAEGANQFFDAQGKVKSFAEISGVLQTAMKGLTKEQQINMLQTMFGTDAIRAAAIMAEKGAEGANALTEAQKNVGGASAVAAERLNNLKGAMEALGGSWEVIRIKIGTPFLPILTKAAQALTKALNEAEPAISAFADRAAAGLDRFITRVMQGFPTVNRLFVNLGQTIGAFVGLELDDYAAGWDTWAGSVRRSLDIVQGAVSSAARTLRGFLGDLNAGSAGNAITGLVGGLIGAFRQIEPVLMQVGRSIVGNITDTFNFLATRVLPPVVSIIQQIGTVLERTLLPAAAATGATLRGILGDTLDWLARTVLPPLLSIIEQTANFWTQVILPTLPSIATALRTTLGETVLWLSTDVWPKLRVAAEMAWGFISGTIIPEIPGAVRLLRDLLGGALEWIGTTGWPALVKGATAAWKFLQDNVIPVIRDTYDWLKVKLPEAINTVVSTFETIKGKVEPIVEAALNGDIVAAIKNLGTAFGEFATLAVGWLGEQVAKINWAEIWAQAKDVATTLSTYVAGLAVDFATWLGEQVAAIPWASVWQRTVDAATQLATYLSKQAVDFATWLGQEVGKIPWALVWANIVQVAEALATYLQGVAVDFATWLSDQVSRIPWTTVWASVTGIAEAAQAEFTTQMKAVDWYAVFDTARRAENDILRWLTDVIRRIAWENVGQEFGTQVVGMLTGKVDWNTIGLVFAERFGNMMGLAVASVDAWIAFNKGFLTGIVQAFTGMDPTEAARAFGAWLGNVLTTGAAQAAGAAGAAVGGAIRGILPGGGGAAPAAPTGGGAGAVGPGSSQAQRIARAKQLAIEQGLDPEWFSAQLMQESGYDTGATSNAGARGIGQFIPGTGKGYAERLGVTYEQMVSDPDLSMRAAAMHMRDLTDQYGGNQERAMSAYFAGPNGGVRPDYVSAVRGRLPQVTNIPAANAVGQATKAPTNVNMAAFPIGNQFEMGLPYADALAACGPAAVALFMEATGRTPNVDEVMRISAKNGWTRGQGMGGVEAFKRTLSDMGVDYATLPTTFEAAAASSQAGNLTAISTAGHYFVSQGFNPETGEFNVGETGTAAGGHAWMTADQITALMGPINGVIQLVGQVAPAMEAAAGATDTFGAATTSAGAAVGSLAPALATAGATLVSTTTDTLGQTTQLWTDSTGSWTTIVSDAAGNILSTWNTAGNEVVTTTATNGAAVSAATTTMGAEVLAQYGLMSEGATVATATMGENTVTTVTDAAGNIVTTWTDAAGTVVDQTLTMADGTVTAATTMATDTQAQADAMAAGTIESATAMAADAEAQAVAMAEQIIADAQQMQADTVAAAEEMGSGVVSTVETMAEDTAEAFKSIEEPAQGATQAMEDVGDVEIEAPDVSDVISAMRKIEEAAKKARSALKDVDKGGGGKGSSKEFAKASGGPVNLGESYLVGESGPERFVPFANGTIIPNRNLGTDISDGGSGGGRSEIVFVIRQPDGRTIEEWYVSGKDLATRRGRD